MIQTKCSDGTMGGMIWESTDNCSIVWWIKIELGTWFSTWPKAFAQGLRQGEVQRRTGSQALQIPRLPMQAKVSVTPLDYLDQARGLGFQTRGANYVH